MHKVTHNILSIDVKSIKWHFIFEINLKAEI